MAGLDASFSASFFRNPMLNNSHFEVARIGDPLYADKFQGRFEQFAATVPPQIERAMRTSYPGTKVTAITIVGSAASFRHYNDIDINVLVNGHLRARPFTSKFRKFIRVADEKHGGIQKAVEIFPYSSDRLRANDYANYFFSKPVIFGTVPDMVSAELLNDLKYAFRATLFKFKMRLETGKLRKATHSLASSCRHVYTSFGLQGRQLPLEFSYVAKTLYEMDVQGRHDAETLKRMNEIVLSWDLDGAPANE